MASHVTEFYNGKSIFITGGTGFLGICLIEKLLRCCHDVTNIYLLIRSKKGKEITERLEELTKNSVSSISRLLRRGTYVLFIIFFYFYFIYYIYIFLIFNFNFIYYIYIYIYVHLFFILLIIQFSNLTSNIDYKYLYILLFCTKTRRMSIILSIFGMGLLN